MDFNFTDEQEQFARCAASLSRQRIQLRRAAEDRGVGRRACRCEALARVHRTRPDRVAGAGSAGRLRWRRIRHARRHAGAWPGARRRAVLGDGGGHRGAAAGRVRRRTRCWNARRRAKSSWRWHFTSRVLATTSSTSDTTARAEGDAFALTGEKSIVQHGAQADHWIVPARLDGEIALFRVARDAAGAEVTDYRTIDGQRAATLKFTGTPATRLGDAHVGAATLRTDRRLRDAAACAPKPSAHSMR